VPTIAAELIESITPNAHGWFFPSATDPSKPVSHGSLYSFMWRQRDREVIPYVTNRDLRRTWKTLAGKAGLSKEIRVRSWQEQVPEAVTWAAPGLRERRQVRRSGVRLDRDITPDATGWPHLSRFRLWAPSAGKIELAVAVDAGSNSLR
jgi:hypothetical protein